MTGNCITKDLIKDPSMWNLLLRISANRIDCVLYCIVEDNSLIYRSFVLDNSAPSHITAVENTIYDNPGLLSDFHGVWCVVETDEFTLVPAECSDRSSLLFKAAFPESHREILTDSTGTDNAAIVMGIENDLYRFIRRTFHNPVITSHLGSLCRYFASRASQGNSVKMAANIRPHSLDIVVVEGRGLLLANTFHFNTPDDAAYYILACRNRLGLDPYNDDIILCGNREIREQLTPILRTYVSRVMPAIFPPRMFKAGKDSMYAPFDLIVVPISE